VLIELAPNGSVAKVTLVDVKNTTNVIDAVSAFGVGAKTGARNFQRNLDYTTAALLDDFSSGAFASRGTRRQVAALLDSKQFDVAIATTTNAMIDRTLVTQLRNATGKTPVSPLRWIP
jgi:hypothetical protein